MSAFEMKKESISRMHTCFRLRVLASVAAAAALLAPAHSVVAQSSDALIDKLVEKGILTADEANTLREETDKDFAKAHSVKTGMPEWVTTMRLGGDLRGRYEGFFADHPGWVDRNRFRYRLRFGFTAVMKDQLEVGFRLASGERAGTDVNDPISTNASLQDNGSKKPLGVDLAYAKWSPINDRDWGFTFTAGKMENPFVVSDAVFDQDYTPEGAAQQFIFRPSEKHALKLNLGEFMIDELGASSHDPYLLGAQLRLDSAWNKHWASSAGVAFLTLQNVNQLTSASVPDQNRGNSRNVTFVDDGKGNLTSTVRAPANGFDTVVADASLTYTFESAPFYSGTFPVKAFGEWMHNGAAESANHGWQVGVTVGKAGKRRTWEIGYRFKNLEGDVWWEELTDSDFGAFYQDSLPRRAPADGSIFRTSGSGYGAGTNVRGHVVRVAYSPYDSLQFNVTFFATELIDEFRPGTGSDMKRLQVDAVWKF